MAVGTVGYDELQGFFGDDLDGLESGQEVLIWADTHRKGIQGRAPDTDGSDGCSKPTGVDEVLSITLK